MVVSFSDHISLLAAYVDGRVVIVDALERQVLNVQDKEPARSRDRRRLETLLLGSFDVAPTLSHRTASYGALVAAHSADGFQPVSRDAYSHRLDPVDLVMRGYDHWDATRWPGRNGRAAFAQVVYSVFVLGLLERLSLRIWDAAPDEASDNLREVQHVLDRLNADAGVPSFVRDARWLIQTAQGPLTRDLAPYFRVAALVAESIEEGDRLEIQKAGVVLAGGHLRSQQRYRAADIGRAFDDAEVLAVTRNSNSMDVALLVGDLVPLLERYEAALAGDDDERRLDLADVILQGLSSDPGLLITHLDLLGPAAMIEHVFVSGASEDDPRYTAQGQRHIELMSRYRDLVARLAAPLSDECLRLDPAGRPYSPLGISYGFCADILWNVALSALMARPPSTLSLEHLFGSRTSLDEKAERAEIWAHLPTRPGEREHFTHSPEWSQQVFAAVVQRLHARASGNVAPTGRLVVRHQLDSTAEALPDSAVNAQEHVITSDIQWAMKTGATAFPRSHFLADRQEGRYLASIEHDGKWFGLSKVVLTACLARARDAVITGVPPALVTRLRLTCREIVAAEDSG
jgi:hypothetical protein